MLLDSLRECSGFHAPCFLPLLLKESKDLVDAAASAPQMVKEGVKKEEADEIAKKFVAAGAKVEIK